MYFWDKEASEAEKKISYYKGKEKEFIIEQLRKNGLNLQYIPINMKSDRDVVLAAVRNDGTALEFASNDLKNDRITVEEALNNSALALEFASPDLQNDSKIVKAVVLQLPYAIKFSECLKGDKEFLTSDMPEYVIGCGFEYLSEDLRNDVEVAKIAIEYSGFNLEYAGAGIRYWCKDLVLSAVSRSKHGALQYVHSHSPLRHDTDVVTAAVAHDWTNVQFINIIKTSIKVKERLSQIALEQMDKSDPDYDYNLRFIDAFTTEKREGHLEVAKNAWVNLWGFQTLYMRIEKEQMPPHPKGFELFSSYTSIFHSVCVENLEKINHQSFSGPS